ncbi:four helix bundle protein [Chryseobacterium aquaticum]|uniref:Four helix bundle protein n=1 Tax=Chryseobacterium aquaticum TaxID=452084 RepID=A0A848N0X4_9FLAO|nr:MULTISPECIES: four helix bundle protein [Chryseobacterium]NMR34687.1 four helix bundle protein [Chryseobacterium aquaticum]NRQ46927.1 four helix bundle protein [Chryseobacterium sp. C-204]
MENEELKVKSEKRNFLKEKSLLFSIDIVHLYKKLAENKEFVMSKQMLRSGTAAGALIREAEFAQSKADFINKLSIALKEANETQYWLELLFKTNFLNTELFHLHTKQNDELISMLTASIKTSKQKLNR